MKIATTYLKPGYAGILNALQSILGEVILWQSDKVPVFDFFYHVKPDLLIVDEEVIDHTFLDAISELNSKIILFGSSVPQEMDVDVVCTKPSISQLMKKHLELNNNVCYIHDYVDVINYIGGQRDERLNCDVGTSFANTNMSIELLELLLHISSVCKLKIVGDNNLTIPNFIGNMSHKRKLDFMKSANIFLDINGSMLLEAAANNVFTFSTIPNKLFPTVDVESFEVEYREFQDEGKRNELTKRARDLVLNSDTNFHKLIDILKLSSIENKEHYITKAEKRIQEILEQ